MKKILSLILAALMLFGTLSIAFAEELPVPVFGDLTADDAEYDLDPAYEKYTVLEYYIENADATVVITCSAKLDNSEFSMEYSFYGDDQKVVCNAAGEISYDKTGFMGGDTPDMIAYILENAIWFVIPTEEEVINFGELTSEDAEYDPNPDYEKYTVLEYYIENADATVVITCSAKMDESEFSMEYGFYGDDQQVVCNAAGEVSYDKTGFMGGDTPDMIAFVLENAVWAVIAK